MKAVERAPAKINLTLAVTGRRGDGYHMLESLVAFARDAYDEVMLKPGSGLALVVAGETAGDAGEPDRNLVLKAAGALCERREGIRAGGFFLKKNLPVAAGLGGGSADAAAALRLLARANDLPLDDPAILDAARATGADVPVCLHAAACVMRGIGNEVGPPLDFRAEHVLLVNPRIACPTPAVFQRLGLRAGKADVKPHHSDQDILAHWRAWPNDLQEPAVALVPAITMVLNRMSQCEGCAVARMSGSGATCFAVFDEDSQCARAQQELHRLHPEWWSARTVLM